ncbi:uncharacterized protein LOC132065353 [Lycium ferocissimum]|uniref:uncharacterized protein LOC132065353 n=1 Tax=Lycium ferocissimum TaxID=112874 RepID=UPI00281677EE|nr:uncharacterized protein LOC132065353 [Lycium ferocissimum]
MRWLKDGDRNTKFFHLYIEGRRKKLALHNIQNSQGDWISSNSDIGQEAVSFYQDQFRRQPTSTDYEMLKKIPTLITEEQNESLIALPSTNYEILNGDSTSGPDGFQDCSNSAYIVSNTQTDFVKERSIVENVLLPQEIIRDINKRNKLHNVVVKLDMAKAYDRVSWIYLTKVLKQFGFSDVVIHMSHRFFHSSRGLKQRDPLSPTLFIIAAEVLARNLNSLHEDSAFKGNYEKISYQLDNKDKSSFYLHEKVPVNIVRRVRRKTGMRKCSFPFTYLGCPVFYGRRKIVYYDSLIKKVMNKVMSWQNRMLSFGGRYILIAHVLQTMPVYLLFAMNPLKGVIDQLHKIFAKFFWSNTAGVKGKHWVAWDKMCLPKDEGVLCFRPLHDISKALFAKVCWNFRTSIYLWGAFTGNKYFLKPHHVIAQDKGASHAWKKIVAVREEVEHQIWWQLKSSTSSSWFDNRTKQCTLYFVDNELAIDEEIEVKKFISGGVWNLQKILAVLSSETVSHIQEDINPTLLDVDNNKAWWMCENNGKFIVKSAWEETRHKQESYAAYKYIWLKGLPIKISFSYGGAATAADDRTIMETNCTFQAAKYFLGYSCYPNVLNMEEKKFNQAWLPPDWPAVIDFLSNYKLKLQFCKVKWKMPQHGLKCNTDRASQGNLGHSSYAFYIRDDRRDVVYAQAN